MDFQTVSVIGLGYIGLPTSAILATHGIQVLGIDVNAAVVSAGHLRAATQPEAVDAFIIAVPAPFRDGHAPDLSLRRKRRFDCALPAKAHSCGAGIDVTGWHHEAAFVLARPSLARSDLPPRGGGSGRRQRCLLPRACATGHSLHELVYMAAALPVVAAGVDGACEMAEDGNRGSGADTSGVADPMTRLLREQELRSTMCQAGLDRVRKNLEAVADCCNPTGRWERT